MADYNEFLNIVKKAGVDAVESNKPVNILYGNVISSSPLEIKIEQKLTLGTKQLVLSRNVTDYYVDMTVNHLTENKSGGSGDAEFSSHNHGYVGTKTFLVHKSLNVGEKVVLLRMQGGQKYLVLDRVVSA